jgi:hypothetical protein
MPIKSVIAKLNRHSMLKDGHKLWIGPVNKDGYGRTTYLSKDTLVHRLSAHLFLGFSLESTLLILHKNTCQYKNCWEPNCLYIGTHLDNMNDLKDMNVCNKCYRPYDKVVKRSNGIITRRCSRCYNKYMRKHASTSR